MIELKDLCKNYGQFPAVKKLSLSVPRGELFCFLGPNGAGKTTTIKVMTGLLSPSSGSAFIDGFNIQTQPVEAKTVMGYVPDMPFLYDRLTATEFFEFTGDLYGLPQAEIREELDKSFDLFGLSEQKNSLINDLSHGMKQRLIYASTFLHKPAVMFIDEPLIGLDPYTIRLLKDILVEKARSGMTIFLTTHILALAEDIADRIGIIMRGRMIACGALPELLEKYGNRKNLEDLFLSITAVETERQS
mgnify:CR=1 FL=1